MQSMRIWIQSTFALRTAPKRITNLSSGEEWPIDFYSEWMSYGQAAKTNFRCVNIRFPWVLEVELGCLKPSTPPAAVCYCVWQQSDSSLAFPLGLDRRQRFCSSANSDISVCPQRNQLIPVEFTVPLLLSRRSWRLKSVQTLLTRCLITVAG